MSVIPFDRERGDDLGAARLALSADEAAGLDALTAPAPVYPGWFNATISDGPIREALGAPR